jgi:hypothetical protein
MGPESAGLSWQAVMDGAQHFVARRALDLQRFSLDVRLEPQATCACRRRQTHHLPAKSEKATVQKF